MTQRSGLTCNFKISITENGKLISETESRAHSFVKNFANLLFYGMNNIENLALKDTANGSKRAAYLYYYLTMTQSNAAGMNLVGTYGEGAQGIVIGTSNTPFNINQYKLGAIIDHGTAAGKMSYGPKVIPNDPSFLTPDIILLLSRDFANNSGSPITVREFGLYGWPTCFTPSSPSQVLWFREVMSDVVVNNGQILNVKIYLKTVVV